MEYKLFKAHDTHNISCHVRQLMLSLKALQNTQDTQKLPTKNKNSLRNFNHTPQNNSKNPLHSLERTTHRILPHTHKKH